MSSPKYRVFVNDKGTYKIQTKFLGLWWDYRVVSHPDGPSSLRTFSSEEEALKYIHDWLKVRYVKPRWKLVAEL